MTMPAKKTPFHEWHPLLLAASRAAARVIESGNAPKSWGAPFRERHPQTVRLFMEWVRKHEAR